MFSFWSIYFKSSWKSELLKGNCLAMTPAAYEVYHKSTHLNCHLIKFITKNTHHNCHLIKVYLCSRAVPLQNEHINNNWKILMIITADWCFVLCKVMFQYWVFPNLSWSISDQQGELAQHILLFSKIMVRACHIWFTNTYILLSVLISALTYVKFLLKCSTFD